MALPEEALAIALARSAYDSGTIRVAQRALNGRSLLVASRQGLFAADAAGAELLLHGIFFGLTRRGGHFYVFEAGDLPHAPGARGRVIRFAIRDGAIADEAVFVTGLDNGCHQIDWFDDRLWVVDTYRQMLLAFDATGASVDVAQPLSPAARDDWAGGYHHVNSVLASGEHVLLLLHNGQRKTGRASAILALDRALRPVDRWAVGAGECHDLACLPDGTLLLCGTIAGELIASDGRRMRVSAQMTRGLAVSHDAIAVGGSRPAARENRLRSDGEVVFLTPDWRVETRLAIPAGPTDLLWIDRADYSLSCEAGSVKPERQPFANT